MSTAFVFDLDDTLYPERQYNLSGFRAVGQWVLEREGIEGYESHCVELYESGVRQNIFDKVCQALGVRLAVPELVECYRSHLPSIELFPDARECLQALKGSPLALITDGYAQVQRRKVVGLGIASRFRSMVFSDDFGRGSWKPSPVPYLETMRRLQGYATRYVYIGDNPAKDFVAARSLGWQTVQVRREGGIHAPQPPSPAHEADLTVSSLREVPWQSLGPVSHDPP